jgi:hypothetical protein
MRNRVLSFIAVFIYGGFFCVDALAGLMVLNPSKDGSIYSENDATNGTGSLFVGRTGELVQASAVRRSLIYFDVSSIPAGSTINSVSLQLTVAISANGVDGQDLTPDLLSLHRISTNWGESASRGGGNNGATADPNDATWNFSRFGNSAWLNPGGDFESLPSGTVTLTRLPSNDRFTSYTITNQVGLVDDVQSWVNDGSSNFGWMMKYEDEIAIQKARGFWSRESTVVNERPTLTIEFTAVPEPSSYLLLSTVAIMASVWRFRCRRVF